MICIGRDIQCLPYAGFFFSMLLFLAWSLYTLSFLLLDLNPVDFSGPKTLKTDVLLPIFNRERVSSGTDNSMSRVFYLQENYPFG